MAIWKVLRYHPLSEDGSIDDEELEHELRRSSYFNMNPTLDMGPFLEWEDSKGLPVVMSWFERAQAAVQGDKGAELVEKLKLDACFQFLRTFPVVPSANNSVSDEKVLNRGHRKRGRVLYESEGNNSN